MYYDSPEHYTEVQKLKQRVDPEDVFHTKLTVQLPEHKKVEALHRHSLITKLYQNPHC